MSTGLTDDSTIGDEAALWRRVPPWHFVYDANLGRWRPSSAAFDNDPDGHPMSVVLGDQVVSEGRDTGDVVAGHAGFALASLTAGLARSEGQGVTRDPLPDEPAHALVFGNKSKSVQRRLAKGASWVIAPPGPAGV